MRVFEYRTEVSKKLNLFFGEWQGYDYGRTQKKFAELLGVTRGAVVRFNYRKELKNDYRRS